jgi:hypothetical protein
VTRRQLSGVCREALPHLLHGQRAGRQRAEQFRFGPGDIEPGKAVRALSTTICRSWIVATSGPGSVVSSVKASPAPSGRQSPAKQNQSSPTFVNFHFDFGGFRLVNSKSARPGSGGKVQRDGLLGQLAQCPVVATWG